jgi:hypothetical protein
MQPHKGKDEEAIKIGPLARQCGMGTAVIILGLGLHLFSMGEVLISLALSGVVVALLGLAVLSWYVVWQGGKRVLAWVASWNSAKRAPRPALSAKAWEQRAA